MKRKIILGMLLLIGSVVTLTWLGANGRGHATQLAAQQLEELRSVDVPALEAADELEAETLELFKQVLQHFYQTQDTRYTAPGTGFGILHLACIFKKTELARCLLLDGAEPNAHSPGEESPLLLAVGTALTPHVSTQQLTSLVDTLLDGGADFARSGHNRTDFLTEAALHCEDEAVLLYLLQKGAKADADTAMPLALHGWPRALEATLQQQPRTDGLLHAAAMGACSYEGDYARCMELLLQHGATVNEENEGMPGVTPLYVLARELSALGENAPQRPQAIEALVWLLRHGADPYLRTESDEEHPGFCPYDFFAMAPWILEALSEKEQQLTEPPLRFSSGLPLLAEVCRTAMTPHPAEQLAPHYDSIASLLLCPTAEMQRAEIYPQALAAAVNLLVQISPERATQSIEAMPLWLLPVPTTATGEEDALAALIRTLQDTPSLAPEQAFLIRQAERLLQGGRAEEASALIELLARCPGDTAQEAITRYSEDARLPLQAGAYAALLYAANLPDARNNGVVAWLQEHKREADTPFLREAVLLTSLERLWFGQMPQEEQQQLLSLMRRIGADTAATAYEHIIRSLDKPDELDTLMAQGDDWKYELEAATARYFLEHRANFLTTPQP